MEENKPCHICQGERMKRIQVQSDQQVLIDCPFCTETTIEEIVHKAFNEGYRRCKEDKSFEDEPENVEDFCTMFEEKRLGQRQFLGSCQGCGHYLCKCCIHIESGEEG